VEERRTGNDPQGQHRGRGTETISSANRWCSKREGARAPPPSEPPARDAELPRFFSRGPIGRFFLARLVSERIHPAHWPGLIRDQFRAIAGEIGLATVQRLWPCTCSGRPARKQIPCFYSPDALLAALAAKVGPVAKPLTFLSTSRSEPLCEICLKSKRSRNGQLW